VTPQLLQAATGCTPELAQRYAEPLSAACAFYGIDTPQRLAAFLAQIGHESGGLRWTTELWGPTPAQQRYEGRRDLGNTQPGDGERFKGRGLIQTTGRFNHARVRDRLRERFPDVPDFEAEPERLAEPQWACLSAADYWDMRGLNALADAGRFIAIGRAINRGNAESKYPANGEADRLARWERVKRVVLPSPQKAPEIQPAALESIPPPLSEPTKEPAMAPLALPFAIGLAKSIFEVFTPLAREKLTKEIDRHTDNPEVAAQIANGVIESAKVATGMADPIAAVAAAKSDPLAAQQIESDALATLERLAPMLDKIAQWDREAWAAEESSREAASQRARGDPNDQDVFLTRSIVALLVGLMIAIGALIGALVWLKADSGTIGTLVGLFAATGGVIVGEFKTRYQHRYGSSRSSGAKDVVMAELARRGRP
jgi:putative chitinase